MLYKAVDVWKRTEAGLIRYRCFETVPSGRYCVQSADSYYPNAAKEPKKDCWLERHFLELLAEQAPSERTSTFSTLEEAIAAHDSDFQSS